MRKREFFEKIRRTKEILSKFLITRVYNRNFDRICCIKIKSRWKIKKQLLLPLVILYLTAFSIILMVFAVIYLEFITIRKINIRLVGYLFVIICLSLPLP